ncbi:MAG: asparagine--tRNA ligase, partial [Leptospirales bacterium]
MQRILIRDALELPGDERSIQVAGWVRTRRDSRGGFSFLEINDGSTIKNIQVVAEAALANYETEILSAATGASVFVSGVLKASPGKGQSVEVHAESVAVLGGADASFPIQKKRHSFEYLREIAHLRPRTNTFGAVFRLRSAVSFAVHNFFQERGFVNVHTPIITGNDAEGAGQLFHVTNFDLSQVPLRNKTEGGGVAFEKDFFGAPVHLTVSGQLEGEAYAMSLGRIYTFGPTFRAENSNTSRHLAEFWMVEPEMAFATLEDDAGLAEDFLRYIFRHVLEYSRADLEFFNQWIDKGCLARLETLAESSFERMSYTEAISILEKSSKKFEFPVAWGRDLQSEHERFLSEEHVKKPVILTDYPKEIKAFYMRMNDDGKTVRAMDVLVP